MLRTLEKFNQFFAPLFSLLSPLPVTSLFLLPLAFSPTGSIGTVRSFWPTLPLPSSSVPITMSAFPSDLEQWLDLPHSYKDVHAPARRIPSYPADSYSTLPSLLLVRATSTSNMRRGGLSMASWLPSPTGI